MRVLAKSLLLLILLLAVPALAQVEPPARVGRVSLVSGTLAFYGRGDTDWSAAKVNLPVAAGAWLMTDPQSRAETRVGPDSIDLSNDTQLNFAELRDQVMQIVLTQGRIDLHLRHLRKDLHLRHLRKDETAEIDVPRGSVWLLQPGVYDIDSGRPDQPTRITVFEGSARFVGWRYRPLEEDGFELPVPPLKTGGFSEQASSSPPAGKTSRNRGIRPERDRWFECVFLQRRVSNEPCGCRGAPWRRRR